MCKARNDRAANDVYIGWLIDGRLMMPVVPMRFRSHCDEVMYPATPPLGVCDERERGFVDGLQEKDKGRFDRRADA